MSQTSGPESNENGTKTPEVSCQDTSMSKGEALAVTAGIGTYMVIACGVALPVVGALLGPLAAAVLLSRKK